MQYVQYVPQLDSVECLCQVHEAYEGRRANRPINVLPIFEKVLELVVKEQLEMYLEINGIITEHQSGFRKYYSCETAIQTVIDEWKLIISKGKIGSNRSNIHGSQESI